MSIEEKTDETKYESVSFVEEIVRKDLAEGTECEVSTDNPYTLYFPFIPVTAENVDDI